MGLALAFAGTIARHVRIWFNSHFELSMSPNGSSLVHLVLRRYSSGGCLPEATETSIPLQIDFCLRCGLRFG